MAFENIWWWPVRPSAQSPEGSDVVENPTWSMGFAIPPQTVYAFMAMQYFGSSNLTGSLNNANGQPADPLVSSSAAYGGILGVLYGGQRTT
jgi:hypothetical protein